MQQLVTPLFLDTDIGTDIDDVYALVLAAASPELDLRGVSTVNNDTSLRAQIARKVLNLLGPGGESIPVVPGRRDAYTPDILLGWMGHEGEGIDLSDLASPVEPRSLPAIFEEQVEQCHAAGNPLRLVTIGALTNAAWLLSETPAKTRAKLGRVVAMASTFEGYGKASAAREHNVACDPIAFQTVLEAGVPLTLIGLNVTKRTAMTEAHLAQIEAIGGPLAEALSGMHRIWFRTIRGNSSPMHDALAIASLLSPDLVKTIPVTGHIRGADGTVVYNTRSDAQVTGVEIAVEVDVEAFHALLYERVLGAVEASKKRNG
jgi:inosine-uridine nucleoside N-ribohydrolase